MSRERENTPDRDAVRREKEEEARLSTKRYNKRLRKRWIAGMETVYAAGVVFSAWLIHLSIEKKSPTEAIVLFSALGLGSIGGVVFTDYMRRCSKRESRAFENLRGEKPKIRRR